LEDVPAKDAVTLAFLANLGPHDLQYIHVSETPVSDQAISNINKMKDLQSLSIDGTTVTDDGLALLELPKAGGLDLGKTAVTDKSLPHIGSSFKRLDWLSFNDTKVTDNGVAALVDLRSLKTLVLIHTPVSDKCLAVMKEFPRLRDLELAGDNITDHGIAAISGISTLDVLDLRETKISDQCVDELAKMQSLKRLDVNSTALSAQAIDRLKKALPNCEVLSGRKQKNKKG
jgi:Leucine-rich repeat (LRR) protein